MLFVCPADELGRVLGALHVRGPIVGLVLLSEVLIPARLLPALPAADEGLTSREETPEIFRDPASRSIPHVASTWAWSPRGSRPSSTRETPDTPLLLPHALPPHVPCFALLPIRHTEKQFDHVFSYACFQRTNTEVFLVA
jgi:hypothetical protein